MQARIRAKHFTPHRRSRAVLLAAVVMAAASGCSRGSTPDRDAVTVPWRDRGSAVVLAVDPRAIANTRSGDALDPAPDLEWVNLLTQEFGSCDRIAATEIEADARGRLAGRRILVLPRVTLDALPLQVLADLEALVEEGLTVIAERPDTTHATFLGLRVATIERAPRLPWPSSELRAATLPRTTLGALPPHPLALAHLVGRYAPAEDPRRRARVAAEAAGRPAMWSLERGKGAWVTLAHDLAEWSFRWRRDTRASEALANGAPWIEAWMGLVAQNDASPAPWPRFAAHPPSATTWLVLLPTSVGAEPSRPWVGSVPLHVRDDAGALAEAWVLPTPFARHDPVDPLSGLRADLRTIRGSFRGVLQVRMGTADPIADATFASRAHTSGAVPIAPEALLAWWQARENSRLDWNFDGEVLSIAVEIDAGAGDGVVLLLPRQWRQRRLVDWNAEWSPAGAEVAERCGQPVLYLDVPAGTRAHARAVYR